MKTSKIIFISFFSFIGLLLLSIMVLGFAFNDVALAERNEKRAEFKSRIKTIKIDNRFKHIFVQDKGSVTIIRGDEQLINFYSYNTKDSLDTPEFDVRNDTLYVIGKRGMNITIKLKDESTLLSIGGINSNVDLSHLNVPALDLNFNGGKVKLNYKIEIGKVRIDLSNKSFLELTNQIDIDTICLNVNNSKINTWYGKRHISLLKGMVENGSDVRLPDAYHIRLDTDSTSKVKMW